MFEITCYTPEGSVYVWNLYAGSAQEALDMVQFNKKRCRYTVERYNELNNGKESFNVAVDSWKELA